MSLDSPNGRQRLNPNRRLVLDLLAAARGVPLFPLERAFELAEVERLRKRSQPRIGWAALFVKAYGMLSADFAELRQTFMRWPWPHIYQHPESVAMLAVTRSTPTGERLFFGRFIAPECKTLVELQAGLDDYKHGLVEQVFRRQMRLGRFPTPLRRIAWWLSLNQSGVRRARRIGTFGLSTVAGLGAINRLHPTCTTTSLSYGPLEADGRMLVTVLCDHRVMDGAPLARALAELEAILQGPIAEELAGLGKQSSAA